MVKNLVILGSTGSIGQQTLDVVRRFKEEFKVLALAAGNNTVLLQEQIDEFKPRYIFSVDEDFNKKYNFLDIESMAALKEADIVVIALSGSAGLKPSFSAASAGKQIALANKETIVTAGYPFFKLCKETGAKVLPIDSEHSAIWQCLNGEVLPQKLILTASGGPFRDIPIKDLSKVTAQQALKHPSWNMGPKVTIDSATLMNKGLEVIEAHHLFNMPFAQIEVIIHPQSIVHSMVEWPDGVVKAQMSLPSMRYPIQYALMQPNRRQNPDLQFLNWGKIASLEFNTPDYAKFPCLSLAIEAGKQGGTCLAVLCAADEEAVNLFLSGSIKFTDIAVIIKQCLDMHQKQEQTLENVLTADQWARIQVQNIAGNLK